MRPLLRLNGVTRRFGGLTAVDDVTTEVIAGGVHGLIGPNGAGKTTLLNLIGGLLRPSNGTIELEGKDVTGAAAHQRASIGIRRTFQNLKLFETLSSLENVLLGLHTEGRAGVFGAVLATPPVRREERALRARAQAALDLVGISAFAELPASSLSYGHKRLLEIARAVVTRPRLLLLDEPAAGLNPTEAASLVELLRRLNAEGITIVLVEHHMDVVMRACARITVLNYGRLLAEGSPEEIQENPRVVEAYLGRPGLEERLASRA